MANSNSTVAAQRRARWQDLLGRWEASGLSQAEFCRRHGIPVWKMAWWRKRLGSQRGSRATPFVRVEMVPAASRPERLELVLRGERRLRFPAELDPARLTAIVTALESVAPTHAEGAAC